MCVCVAETRPSVKQAGQDDRIAVTVRVESRPGRGEGLARSGSRCKYIRVRASISFLVGIRTCLCVAAASRVKLSWVVVQGRGGTGTRSRRGSRFWPHVHHVCCVGLSHLISGETMLLADIRSSRQVQVSGTGTGEGQEGGAGVEGQQMGGLDRKMLLRRISLLGRQDQWEEPTGGSCLPLQTERQA